jgi:hypothetical protein
MNKVTAVEWFVEQLPLRIKNMYVDEITKCKQMEKEQIKDAFNSGMVNSVDWFNDGITEEAEQYYNETYILNKNNI